MKIIISHDIDHWQWSDHFGKDLFLLKHIARTLGYGVTGRLTPSRFLHRFEWLWRRQQHRLDELVAFNAAHEVPATYFVGMANALSLSYSLETAAEIVEWLHERGCMQVGVHGIAYDDTESIRLERERFREIVGHDQFGIRMHYLRSTERTLKMLSKAGYAFDSTKYSLKAPYLVEGMVEFPIGIMDVRLLRPGRNDLSGVKEQTMAFVRQAETAEVGFFTINFHDPYFSSAYPDHRDWYIWLISWLRDRDYEFTDFATALNTLRQGVPTDSAI